VKRRDSTLARVLRWLLVIAAGGAFFVFATLFAALPGFGYRTPRVVQGDLDQTSAAPVVRRTPISNRGEASPVAPLTRHPLPATLFFPRADLPYALSPVQVVLDDEGDIGLLVDQVLAALSGNPDAAGLLPAIPPETRRLTHFMREGLLILSLSPAAQEHTPGGLVSSYAALYAMVNSLTSLPGVERVRFLISNQEALTFRDAHRLDREYRYFAKAVLPAPPPSTGPGLPDGIPPGPPPGP
jgi:hypothetical protein